MTIDIVIPVYNAPDDLRACVDSVLAHTRGDYRLTLIDDASPDAGIARCFADYAARALPQVTLLANAVNLGFTGTANRGMRLSRNDVVLLNSDTIVSAGWLDALVRCAQADARVGTITPFTNNAEICSYPRFCRNNAWPDGADTEPTRAALAAAAVPTYPDLPTGVGFCFYIRRTLIDEIGTFDTAFGAGYGEENDFCLRAAALGWRNVLCDDAFVVHTGGRSFTDQKALLVPKNTATLLARHPGYAAMVQHYVAADPLRPLREAALSQAARLHGPALGVLHIIHHHGGGTESHVRALIDAARSECRHYLAVAVGDDWQLEEHRSDGSVCTYALRRAEGEDWPQFMAGLCGAFGVNLVHVHNLSACREGIIAGLMTLGVPWGYTVHDLNFACPTITFIDAAGRYCGAVTDVATCSRCLAAQPEFAHIDIAQWRSTHQAFVARAAFLVAPSHWAAQMFDRYFGRLPVVIPHGHVIAPVVPSVAATNAARLAVLMPDDGAVTFAVLGAVGPDKGSRRLEHLVELARERGAAVRFVLIGYLDRQHGPWQSGDARFTVHGRYAPAHLPQLLQHYGVQAVLYPSVGPETFSYTLSEAWSAGLPVIVPPIGALAERVAASDGAGFVLTAAQWHDDAVLLDRLQALAAPAPAGGPSALTAAALRVASVTHPTLAGMTATTLALYADAQAGARAPAPTWPPRRLRDALHYHPWQPPAPPADVVAARRSLRWKLATLAKWLRRHPLGASVHDWLPSRWTDALRAHLR